VSHPLRATIHPLSAQIRVLRFRECDGLHRSPAVAHPRLFVLLLAALLGVPGVGAQGTPAAPQREAGRDAEFKRLAAQLVQQRLDASEEKEEPQARALAILDEIVLEALNRPGAALEALNARLATLVAQQPPLGEGYRVIPLTPSGSSHIGYALAVNFGLGGPSAVRLYAARGGAGSSGPAAVASGTVMYRLAARIDRFVHPDLFDEFLELAPVAPDLGVFVTVTGRTDERRTGSFIAWHFNGREVAALWTSDLLEHSAYEVKDGEFILRYCADPEEGRPAACARMVRERYAFHGQWRRLEQSDARP